MDDDAPSWWARASPWLMPLLLTVIFTVLLAGTMLLIMWMWPDPAASEGGLELMGAVGLPTL